MWHPNLSPVTPRGPRAGCSSSWPDPAGFPRGGAQQETEGRAQREQEGLLSPSNRGLPRPMLPQGDVWGQGPQGGRCSLASPRAALLVLQGVCGFIPFSQGNCPLCTPTSCMSPHRAGIRPPGLEVSKPAQPQPAATRVRIRPRGHEGSPLLQGSCPMGDDLQEPVKAVPSLSLPHGQGLQSPRQTLGTRVLRHGKNDRGWPKTTAGCKTQPKRRAAAWPLAPGWGRRCQARP